MNRSKIEYVDHTWNPITGCRHDCPYCYARTMTTRFAGDVRLNKMATQEYHLVAAADASQELYVLDQPMLNETGNPLVYPFGFEPTLHRYRMDILNKLKMGNNILVGAMADIFGKWIPDNWIKDIITICINNFQHNYLFLTKNPERYKILDSAGFLPTDKNLWYGSTLTKPEDKYFTSKVHNTFWSIEPIHAPFRLLKRDSTFPNWIIVGAETGRRKNKIVPKKEWIENIVEECEKAGIPIFMKNNLLPIMGKKNMRQEIPLQLQRKKISPKMESRLYDICCICKEHNKKNEMITLCARSKRGEQPKQYGFMCQKCFREKCEEYGIKIPELEGLKKK